MTKDETGHHGDRTWAEANVKSRRFLRRSEASVDFHRGRSGLVCMEITFEQVTEKSISQGIETFHNDYCFCNLRQAIVWM